MNLFDKLQFKTLCQLLFNIHLMFILLKSISRKFELQRCLEMYLCLKFIKINSKLVLSMVVKPLEMFLLHSISKSQYNLLINLSLNSNNCIRNELELSQLNINNNKLRNQLLYLNLNSPSNIDQQLDQIQMTLIKMYLNSRTETLKKSQLIKL